jgi:hypothetical protein
MKFRRRFFSRKEAQKIRKLEIHDVMDSVLVDHRHETPPGHGSLGIGSTHPISFLRPFCDFLRLGDFDASAPRNFRFTSNGLAHKKWAP